MKITGIDFPNPLLNALRDGTLVVFAGAGVSMSPPAVLPSFRHLAKLIENKTGESISEAETEDRFMGRLKDLGVNVHQLVVDILQQDDPKPTPLHLNIIRCFEKLEDIRIVTTNFDELFTQATICYFDSKPAMYQAPVLPLGSNFQGIVHLHGTVNELENMVLTHQDFGRAYLTESDGWARRFLIELFTHNTVLFVGYSHADTMMNYLTPSLPPDGVHRPFAMIGNQHDDFNNWHRMGIMPISFPQENHADFRGLENGLSGLADFFRKGVLDWQHEITTIARGKPPIDEDGISTIEHALATPDLTSFFIKAAEHYDWIGWLDKRGYLKSLFNDERLEVGEAALSQWLASKFVVRHHQKLFSVIDHHGRSLNPDLWNRIARQLGLGSAPPEDAKVLSRWVHFLISCTPRQINYYLLSDLAKSCAQVGAFQGLLQVYDIMIAHRSQILPSYESDSAENRQFWIKQVWEECLSPHLQHIGRSLLDRITMRLEERHATIVAWEKGNQLWDVDSYDRSAIEPNEQDRSSRTINTLIDIARDCLEWLAREEPESMDLWCNRFAGSDAPLLRRLSIHGMTSRVGLDADHKIAWLLERCDMNEIAVHHEMYRAVALVYPQAGSEQRIALIQAVSEYQLSENALDNKSLLEANHRFNWFHWLYTHDQGCSFAKAALDSVREQHPEFGPAEHPDFTHWTQISKVTSPFTVEDLLAMPISEVLLKLSVAQSTVLQTIDEPIHHATLDTVTEAARVCLDWGLRLADAMVASQAWTSNLWEPIIRAWATAEFDRDSMKNVLSHISIRELHHRYAQQIADVLCQMIQGIARTDETELIFEICVIAIALRPHAAVDKVPQLHLTSGDTPQYVRWLGEAINHAFGKLALFWTLSVELWQRRQENYQESLNVEFRKELDAIITMEGVAGKFGRTVLASNFHFFLAVDEDWAYLHLLPLFDNEHEDFLCAWDGFLTWGRLTPPVAERMKSKFIGAVARVIQEFEDQKRERFAEYYVRAMTWLIKGADDEWISKFLKHADKPTKNQFARQIGHHLRNLDEPQQREWWNVWVKNYWSNRLLGINGQLAEGEIAPMLSWVVYLPSVFRDAVNLAVQLTVTSGSLSLLFFNLDDSSIVERHPVELAKFLVSLYKFDVDRSVWLAASDVVEALLSKDLPSDLERHLREIAVQM